MMMENTFPSGGGDDDDVHHRLQIPGDVLIEILVWLPVVSLLRFKSVCKSWLALIESSFFIHLHVATSSSTTKFGNFIFQTFNRKETSVFMLTSRFGNGGGVEVEEFRFPPFYMTTTVPVEKNKLSIAGSCNGLICVLDSLYTKVRGVYLCNPATRQFRLLPKPLTFKEEEEEEKIHRHIYDVFGFGFDVKTMDYKVFKISSFFHRKVMGKRIVLRVQVYSLISNSWRVLEEEEGDGGINSLFAKPVQELYIEDGEYLNGSYFLNVSHKTEDVWGQLVLSFDFTKEIFTAIQFPDNHADDFTYSLFLACYYFGEKKIATLSRGRRGGDDDDSNLLVYDIWVLNIIERHDQEKEEESYYWTKLRHSIRITKPKKMRWEDPIIPRFISNDGEFALIENRGDGIHDCKLQLFNLVTKEEKTVFPTGMGLRRADVYKPSLVSIVGGGGGNGNGTAAAAAADWGVLW